MRVIIQINYNVSILIVSRTKKWCLAVLILTIVDISTNMTTKPAMTLSLTSIPMFVCLYTDQSHTSIMMYHVHLKTP